MNATHGVCLPKEMAMVISIKKNQPKQGEIFTVRFRGEQPENTGGRPIDRGRRTGIAEVGPDLFFVEWDFVD